MIPSQFQALSYLGLTPEEINVYIACISLGEAKASDIAHRAKMTRTAVYRYLERLQSKGLVLEAIKEGRKRYHPCEPNVLKELFREHMNNMQRSLPALTDALEGSATTIPKFRYYPEIRGIKLVLEEILKNPTKSYRVFGSIHDDEFFKSITEDYMTEWTVRRIKSGVHHKSLRPYSGKNRETKNPLLSVSGTQVLREIRYAPPSIIFTMLTYIYDRKIAFVNGKLGKQFAVVFESEEIYESLGSVFDFIWGISETVEDSRVPINFEELIA